MDPTFGNHLIFITDVCGVIAITRASSVNNSNGQPSATRPHQRKTLALELIRNNDQQRVAKKAQSSNHKQMGIGTLNTAAVPPV